MKRHCSRTYTCITDDLVDGMSAEDFSNSLKVAFSQTRNNPYRRLHHKLRVVNTVAITAQFPWLQRNSHPSIDSIYGRLQKLRAAKDFQGHPYYDFIEFKNGNQRCYGQVRLLFEQTYTDMVDTTGKYLALVRMLEQTEPKYYGEQEIFFAGGGSELLRRTLARSVH